MKTKENSKMTPEQVLEILDTIDPEEWLEELNYDESIRER